MGYEAQNLLPKLQDIVKATTIAITSKRHATTTCSATLYMATSASGYLLPLHSLLSTGGPAHTCLAIGKDGDMVPSKRRVQQRVDATQLDDLLLGGLRAQARMELEVPGHGGTLRASHLHLMPHT